MVGSQRRLEAGRFDALGDRRALASRYDEALEALEVPRDANLGRLGTELAQDADVRLEAALDR
jgi:hypothetical protein